jgi:hypothetical protein
LWNVAPARKRGTRCGALTARQRVWADSMSLNAFAIPAALEPGPLVTRCRSLTVANVDSKLSCQAAWILVGLGRRARWSASFHMCRMITLASWRLWARLASLLVFFSASRRAR